jgi:hypothetical protein
MFPLFSRKDQWEMIKFTYKRVYCGINIRSKREISEKKYEPGWENYLQLS